MIGLNNICAKILGNLTLKPLYISMLNSEIDVVIDKHCVFDTKPTRDLNCNYGG